MSAQNSGKSLYLLRHLKSDWGTPGLDDKYRHLAPRGQAAGNLMRMYMADLVPSLDLILCSTAVRAGQTLAHVISVLPGLPVAFKDELYTFDAEVLLKVLKAIDDKVTRVMLVGHNPAMENLAMLLCHPDASVHNAHDYADMQRKYPTGSLARINLPITQWRALSPHEGKLESFTRPKQLD